MNKKIADVLKEAKALIIDPENWTQGCLYRNAIGDQLQNHEVDFACKFCTLGALIKAEGSIFGKARYFFGTVFDEFAEEPGLISEFNDSHTHEEVMEMWDKVIAAAEKQGV